MLSMTVEESQTPAPKNLSQAWPFGEGKAKTTSTGDANAALGAQVRKVLIVPLPGLESAMDVTGHSKGRQSKDQKCWI